MLIELITWDGFLPSVSAAEAGHTTRNDHHETHTNSSHYQQQFEVNLTIFTRKPWVTVAGDLSAV